MNNTTLFKKTALAASIALLTACSDSGSTTASSTDGTSVGVITGFGSTYQNGVKYNTDTASFTKDGRSVSETDLRVGDKCTIDGSVNTDGTTGTAVSITCSDELEGYVGDVSGLLNVDAPTITVMGQTVSITADTVFDSDTYAAIDELIVGDIVEVYGYSDGAGTVVATRVETKAAGDIDNDIEVKGLVSNLDANLFTFQIGSLIVDYSDVEMMPTLTDGLYVEVKSNTAPVESGTTFTMTATYIEIEDDGDMDVDGEEGDEFEITGIVSELSETSFVFNGTTLVEFASLETEDDFDFASITNGMVITLEGYIDANGNFVAEEIEEEHSSDMEAEGLVTALTETSVTMDVNGESKTFIINNDTRMIDDSDVDPVFYFSLADVVVGNYVEVEYYMDETTGDMIATEFELEDEPVVDVIADPAPAIN